jgi:hypothetical protein
MKYRERTACLTCFGVSYVEHSHKMTSGELRGLEDSSGWVLIPIGIALKGRACKIK